MPTRHEHVDPSKPRTSIAPTERVPRLWTPPTILARRAILSTSLPILLSLLSLILFHTQSLRRQVACPKMRAHSLLWLLGTAVQGLNILITVSGCCPSQVKRRITLRLADPTRRRTTTASPLPTLVNSTRNSPRWVTAATLLPRPQTSPTSTSVTCSHQAQCCSPTASGVRLFPLPQQTRIC